jgi:hypothetical protein
LHQDDLQEKSDCFVAMLLAMTQYFNFAVTTGYGVIASGAMQHVIASAAKQHVIASRAKQHVIASRAKQSKRVSI